MKSCLLSGPLAALALFLAGCQGIPAPGEKQARHDLGAVEALYRPRNSPPSLPDLAQDSSLTNLLAHALFNQPRVAAAFYDWSASVEDITVARSLPDPQLTFQAYIQNTLTSLMPGFMQQFPGPGKLQARASVAAAGAQSKYFVFEQAVLQAGFNLKSAYYQLGLWTEQLRLTRLKLSLLEMQERVLRAQEASGTTSLRELLQVRAQRDRLHDDLANLVDSGRPLQAKYKAALGLSPRQPDPPIPSHFEMPGDYPDSNALFRMAMDRNPELMEMEASVREAEAGIAVAYKDRVPDFNAGLSAEVYHPPFYWPQVGMTFPLWRDKLAAELARAQANELASKSRLKSSQIDLAADFAEKWFAYSQNNRNLSLVEGSLLPQARQTLDSVRAGYQSGPLDFSSLAEAQMALLDLKLEAAGVRTARQVALMDISLMVAGEMPADAPVLSSLHKP